MVKKLIRILAVATACAGAGCQSDAGFQPGQIAPSDATLQTEIRYRLRDDPVVARMPLVVTVKDGQAILVGDVPLTVKARVLGIARSTPGVRGVEDRMTSR